MKLLIDGYNLIPAIPELRRLLREDLEEGREGLIDLLAVYRRSAGAAHSITVIFDGKDSAEPSGETRRAGIAVRFSRGEIADDLILRLLAGEMRGAVLVTSDRALGEAAREFAGAVVRTGEFRDRLLQARHMEGEDDGEEEEEEKPPPSGRQKTKKRGNPRRLSKKERQRRGRIGNL